MNDIKTGDFVKGITNDYKRKRTLLESALVKGDKHHA